METYSKATSRTRQGQMQMGEMVLVLLVAFLIGIAALTFFLKRSSDSNTRDTLADNTRELAITAKEVASLPGIRYSLDSREDLTVVDMGRARAFAGFSTDSAFREVYHERFGGYKATITAVYPPASDYMNPADAPFSDTELVLFDYTDSVAAKRNSVPFVIPVLLYEPKTSATGFGLLEVTQVVS